MSDNILIKTCQAIGKYYELMGKSHIYYSSNITNDKGLFFRWFEEEEMDINDIENEFSNFEECCYLEFDENFPFPHNIINDKEKIQFEIMRYCFKNHQSPTLHQINQFYINISKQYITQKAFDESMVALTTNDEEKKEHVAAQKKVELTWWKGTEILKRKWTKRDEIEYDSDPERIKNDNRSHIHKGRILKVDDGKILILDVIGMGYDNNYKLDQISIKLPAATPENTVKRQSQNNKVNDLYSVIPKTSKNTKREIETENLMKQIAKNDEEKKESVIGDKKSKLIWCEGTEILKRKWTKKDEIEYDSDPEHKNNDNKSHIHRAIILNIDDNKKRIVVKDIGRK